MNLRAPITLSQDSWLIPITCSSTFLEPMCCEMVNLTEQFWRTVSTKSVKCKYLSRPVTDSLIHALITCGADYCNSLLYGLLNSSNFHPETPMDTECHSSVGHGNTKTLSCYTITFPPHWLPICYRIKFKILLLTFKCLCGLAPNYLINLISVKKQSRYHLRSKKSLFLELPSIKTRPTLGEQ